MYFKQYNINMILFPAEGIGMEVFSEEPDYTGQLYGSDLV